MKAVSQKSFILMLIPR